MASRLAGNRDDLRRLWCVSTQRVATEAPDALDRLAQMAEHAAVQRDLALAGAAAGAVVLSEHVGSALYRHSARMLALLTTIGPDGADGADDGGDDALLAWAGAAIAHTYGVLPSWPRPDVPSLLERARRAPADLALALGCALGEVCERNGEDAEFATLHAQLATLEGLSGASAYWRGHWAIVCAWHHAGFGRNDDALRQLAAAQALAAEHSLVALGATAALQRARLIEWKLHPALALRLADEAVARADPAHVPLWLADHADVHCRVALGAQDFHAAVGHARRAVGCLRAAAVWPGFLVTYRVNEAYALLGCGAFDAALACLSSLVETPNPRYIVARLRVLQELALLIAADQTQSWATAHHEALARLVRSLRELEWPSVLPLLPGHIARLFARALTAAVEPDWVRAAIRTRALPAPPGAPVSWPWAVKVRALGCFEVETDTGAAAARDADVRKAASKPLELLRLLAAHGTDAALVDVVANALWPGDGREGRQKAFDITVSRLRRLLRCEHAVVVHDRRVGLNREFVWIDVQALKERLTDAEGAAGGSVAEAAAVDAALSLYAGACLADSAAGWAETARRGLRERLAATLLRAARGPGISGSQVRERALRATAADPSMAALIASPDR